MRAGMTDLASLSITEAGRMLRARTISSVDLVEAILRRIEDTEPAIHAYVLVFADAARADARHADRELASGQFRGPLHGIPLAIKDLLYTRGVPTEAGSQALRGFIPPYDATVVRRLRDAGAIIIGKTVTHELAYGVNAPPTRSPWGEDAYPGGSSAGSGAAVAARSAFGAMGTDTGGSIREPAALNGLVGMKPTFGLVSRHGVVPLSPSLDHAGPITRTVEDCAILLQAIAGFDRFDSDSSDAPIPQYRTDIDAGAAGLTIGVERSFYFGGEWDEVRVAVEGVIAEFAGQKAHIVDVRLPEIDLMSPAALTILFAEATSCHGHLLRDHGEDLDPATRVMLELGAMIPASQYVTAQRARTVLRAAMKNLFRGQRLDALLTPTLPTTTMSMAEAMAPDESGESPLSSAIHYTIPANVTGQPAMTVPCGFSSAGLPIGFQLIGRPFDEPTLFRLGRAYEREHDWITRQPRTVSGSSLLPG
jgi:aspartyl-tRNA(Asn)/glutamyl-tRNA(Gln) amidotransferase subunit A